jgi:hypothetical protein
MIMSLSFFGLASKGGRENSLYQKKYAKSRRTRKTGVVPFNKWIQSCVWKANGLPHAATLGFFNRKKGVLNGSAVKLSEENLTSFFKDADFPIVIKPIDGANGIGFDVIVKFDNKKNTVSTRKLGTISVNSFISCLFDNLEDPDGYVLQDYIVQHHDLSAFYEHSVNSLRVVTFMDNDKKISVDCALMKFGAGKAITDNDNVGGRVFAFMDTNDGSLSKGFTGSFSQLPIEFHPDSKMRIFQYTVPFWKESLELAMSAHQVLPYPRHLGWDIAISEKGPLIIEPNSFLAISVYQKGGNDMADATGLGNSCKEFA